jgi:hypothetical protein
LQDREPLLHLIHPRVSFAFPRVMPITKEQAARVLADAHFGIEHLLEGPSGP